MRVAGTGDLVFVLLHGLTASGDTFGGEFDRLAEHGTIVVPDLLGFGRSLDLDRHDFSLEAHLQALDFMLESLGIAEAPLVLIGHSMGSVLAPREMRRRASFSVSYSGAQNATTRSTRGRCATQRSAGCG